MIYIKEAKKKDIKKLLILREESLKTVWKSYYSELNDFEKELIKKETIKYYKKYLNKLHFAIFVYEDNKIIGTGSLCLQKEIPSPGNLKGISSCLMNIYVIEEFRKKGIGKLITNNLIDKSKSLGATKIYLESSRSGMPLYKSLGFRQADWYFVLH